VLKDKGLDLDAVAFLDVDTQEIVRRLSGRWTCPNPQCQATYHTQQKPPKTPGLCDECGTPLVQREDDREETVRKRLEVFHEMNAPLLDHYRAKGLLVTVPGQGDIEEIYRDLEQRLVAK
jgi:adenylate kinase